MIKALSIVLIFLLAIFPVVASSQEEGLAFYLIKGSKNTNVGRLDKLPIDKPLFTQKEIISYSISNHSMMLTESALIKLKSVSIGSSFVACVNRKAIYSGTIWNDLRSASCSEIVLMVPIDNSAQVSLEAGYPTHSDFTGSDERSNKSILDALKASHKLR
jgi:hypothetical protein